MAVALQQFAFRIRTDATAAQGGTPVWAAAQNVNYSFLPATTPFRIRFSIENTGTTASSSTHNLFVSRNGGAFAQVPSTSSGNAVFSTDATAGASADNSSITTALLTGATGTFTAGQYDSSGATASITMGASSTSELEFGLAFNPAVAATNDTYAFHLQIGATVYGTYTATPTIKIQTDAAAFAGAGALTARALLLASGSTLFAGSGALSAVAAPTQGAARFAGVGALSAVSLAPSSTASFAGAGALSARATVLTSTVIQAHYRFRTDTGAVDGAPTWGAAQDTTYNPGGTTPFRLRMSVAAPPPTPVGGLIGHWGMDDDCLDFVNGLALDLSGQGNSGAMTGLPSGSEIAGRVMQALLFDGSTSIINLPSYNYVDPTKPFTISAWVYLSALAANSEAVIVKLQSADGFYLKVAYDNQGVFNGAILNAGGSANWCPFSNFGGVPIDSTWRLLTYTYNGAGTGAVAAFLGNYRLYINGVVQPLTLVSNGVTRPNTSQIGGNGTGTAWWAGGIDDVRVYNRALSPAEVAALYTAGLAGQRLISPINTQLPSSLIGYWGLDDDCLDFAHALALDLSGQGNSGAMSGLPSASEITGQVKQALVFDGATSIISLPSFNYVDPTKPFTISAWVYCTAVGASTGQANLCKLQSADGFYLKIKFDTGVGFNGICLGGDGSGVWPYFTNNAGVPLDSVWRLLTITYNGAGSGVISNYSMYLNAVAQTLSASTTGALNQPNTSFIGGSWAGATWWTGGIDDFRIYNRALSPAEVTALYNLGLAGLRLPGPISAQGPYSLWCSYNGGGYFQVGPSSANIQSSSAGNAEADGVKILVPRLTEPV